MIEYTEKDGWLFFAVRVSPRASKTKIVGAYNGALKIRLAAPPVSGAANDELIKLLAQTFGTAKSDVEIVSGQTSKSKHVKILGAGAYVLQRLLVFEPGEKSA